MIEFNLSNFRFEDDDYFEGNKVVCITYSDGQKNYYWCDNKNEYCYRVWKMTEFVTRSFADDYYKKNYTSLEYDGVLYLWREVEI